MSRASESRIEELEWAIERVLQTFEAAEAQGYRSRDRQFAIEMLRDVVPKEENVGSLRHIRPRIFRLIV